MGCPCGRRPSQNLKDQRQKLQQNKLQPCANNRLPLGCFARGQGRGLALLQGVQE